MKSLTTPEDIFYKSRRFVLLSSLLVFLTFYADLSPDDSSASISFFQLKISKPEALPTVFLFMLFYSLWQFIAAWLVQTDEVRKSLVNRIDFFITGVIAILSIIYYLHKTGVYVLEIALDIPTLVKFLSFSIGTFLGFIGILHGVEKIREKLDKAIKKIEMEIETLLIKNEWELTYNEKTGQHKKIKFLANGNIGAGKNNNETTWRVREGLLEILNLQGNIYSRFRYDQDNNVFNHTNDLDTLSKRNQIIRPFRMVA